MNLLICTSALIAADDIITIINYTDTDCDFCNETSGVVIPVPVSTPANPISIVEEQITREYVINGIEYQSITTTKSVTGLPPQTSTINIIVTREIANHAGVRGDLLVNDGVVRRLASGLYGRVVPIE